MPGIAPQRPVPPQGGGSAPVPNFPNIPPPAPIPPPTFDVQAQQSPELQALSGRWNTYLDDIDKNTGHAMDVAGQKFRDIREGGAKSLAASEGSRGINTGTSQEKYAADTARGEQSAIANTALERERMKGMALQGAGQAARSPLEMALQEKQLGLEGWGMTNAANSQAFNQWLAMLQAQRSSPIYTGS